jgi:hypothetical protein
MTTMLSEYRPHGVGIFSDPRIHALGERYAPKATLAGAGGERMFGGALKGIEVIGVGGAMSYLNAKHAAAGRNAYEVMGVPADLALGLLFSGFALTGYFGQQGDHALNFGLGFLSAYACRMGSIWGAAAREARDAAAPKANLPAPAVAGPYASAPSPERQAQKRYPWAA